jgi:hypothetical protein
MQSEIQINPYAPPQLPQASAEESASKVGPSRVASAFLGMALGGWCAAGGAFVSGAVLAAAYGSWCIAYPRPDGPQLLDAGDVLVFVLAIGVGVAFCVTPIAAVLGIFQGARAARVPLGNISVALCSLWGIFIGAMVGYEFEDTRWTTISIYVAFFAAIAIGTGVALSSLIFRRLINSLARRSTATQWKIFLSLLIPAAALVGLSFLVSAWME